ncbi:MAG: Glycerol-3-phosphate dehydrogenase [NAD(P)+] [Nitrospira sp.]|nr:MAG: Glycerol-3-phosphate dehydrogenase [NAD(P)+] [Nitrospira sp.]
MTLPSIRRVAVIGAGAWGTALARHLAGKEISVRLWAYEVEVVQAIQRHRENRLYLSGVPLPTTLSATNVLSEALSGADCVIFAVPSHVARSVLKQIGPLLLQPIPLISATKGIEEETLKLMTQVMQEVLPASMRESLMVLSGPSFAAEVSQGQPSAICLAGPDTGVVKAIQTLLMTSSFRVYADDDLIGVQLGGALKNVMALAAGVVDGLALGHNARAALITRGLAEMIRLGAAMGADQRTFYGLSGVGDLILTCTGPLSRNHSVGVRLGKGERLAGILAGMQAVAEGVRTAKAALGLAIRYGVDMPIVQEVNAVLFADKPCRRAVGDLMEREAKEEKSLS